MTNFPISIRLLSILLGTLLFTGCETSRNPDVPPRGTAILEANVFQDQREGSGGTLIMRSLDGEAVQRNRAGLTAGHHEVLFEFEATTSCAPETGCAVRRYHDRITFDAEADHGYRLRAGIGDDGALLAEIVDLETGKAVADARTREAVVEHEGYPNEAWQGLCDDADMGDAKARRAIGLHYWRGWWPAERDVILAYQWLSLAAQANDSAAPAFRDSLATEMTSDQIGKAQRLIAAWRPGICVTEAKLK